MYEVMPCSLTLNEFGLGQHVKLSNCKYLFKNEMPCEFLKRHFLFHVQKKNK